MILRAPIPWLATLLATYSGGYRIAPVSPPSQLGGNPQCVPPLFALNAASQKLTLPGAIDAWIIIDPAAVRVLAGVNSQNMPAEVLQLSQECAADFRGSWPAVFQALGFTSFVPTVGAIPTMNC